MLTSLRTADIGSISKVTVVGPAGRHTDFVCKTYTTTEVYPLYSVYPETRCTLHITNLLPIAEPSVTVQ